MSEKNKKFDYYVLWSYIILDIVSTAVYLMKYDEDIFIWVVELAVNGGVFWYWYKDKDYTFRWLLFGERGYEIISVKYILSMIKVI